MTLSPTPAKPVIEWGWAGRALIEPSGDLHVVVEFDGGAVVALLDGLGHGFEAAEAVRAAVPSIEAHAREPVLDLVLQCHTALRKTRGAVMTVASFSSLDSSMTWTGVGNVDGILVRARDAPEARNEAISVRGGVVGFRLPPLRADRLAVSRGDTLVMATDGIHSAFVEGVAIRFSPQELAESILARYAKGTDDAHVLVARYLGASP
ncbi:SpoIIE family protein phosphatase [Trinickia fusca]|uniref:Stage II sporulation protein E (SpoIIE) n=1 Tax=Trinickia fusca TaxID=2419777 RepID=A0A494X981_9BURK|nr:SpoIIE family protein phosphatase [Trinickia fusca]RKP47010.1 stage II sporulation protein E (SpoIIE) [Trinickia fusca]